MRVTRRDVAIAAGAVLATWSVTSFGRDAPALLGPTVFEWPALVARPTDVGALGDGVRQRRATLDELEMHTTTLKPGLSTHPPHQRANEELVIIKDGTVEVLS